MQILAYAMSVQKAALVVTVCALFFTAVNCTIAVLNYLMTRFPWLKISAMLIDDHRHKRFDVLIFNSGAAAWGVNVRLEIEGRDGHAKEFLFQWPMQGGHPRRLDPLMTGQSMRLYYPCSLLPGPLAVNGGMDCPEIKVAILVYVGEKNGGGFGLRKSGQLLSRQLCKRSRLEERLNMAAMPQGMQLNWTMLSRTSVQAVAAKELEPLSPKNFLDKCGPFPAFQPAGSVRFLHPCYTVTGDSLK